VHGLLGTPARDLAAGALYRGSAVKIDLIVIHCSLTKVDQLIGADEIRRWHVEERGWNDIGYHYVIPRYGPLELGRPAFIEGAHVKGHNDNTIGICLVGGMGADGECEDNFPPGQGYRLGVLLNRLCKVIPNARIVGHRDLDPTRGCPCFDVQALCETFGLPYGGHP